MKQEIHDSDEKIFCSYCKGSIEQDETYIVKNGERYHEDCWIQINTYSPTDYFNEQEN